MGNKLAVIDSDFFQHLAERDPKGEKIRFVFDAMEYQPVFHSFVYRDELFNSCITAQKLVDEAYIQVIDYDKYLTTKLHKLQYDMEFRQLFQILNRGDDYNQSGRYKDCFSFHEHGKNVGEIHSALMAKRLGIVYMCSDDLRARGQLQDFVNSGNYELSIMQCADFFLQYAKLPEKSLKRKEFKDWMKHIFLDRGQKKLYERICEQWECAEQM